MAKKADLSLSPSIIIPLLTNENYKYRVRTLMDPGSGTNWIVKDILKYVEFTMIGSEVLEVITFNNTVKQKFNLVEVYFNDLEGLKQALRCYVIEDFARHIAVKGMLAHIVTNSHNKIKLFKHMVDPASNEIDHVNKGTGIIISSSAINNIRTESHIVLLPELDILLEPTIFGVAISGRIPPSLVSQVEVLQANYIVPTRTEVFSDTELYLQDKDSNLNKDIDFLWCQENLGVQPGEMHENDQIAVEHFLDSVQHDQETNQYTVSLPWNEKKYLLKDNMRVAAGRTRRQQEEMIRNKPYGIAMCEAVSTMVEDNTVERVDVTMPNNNTKYYMPFRGIMKKDSTTSCRLVMDASSKPSASDISLNQALYQGPNLTQDLAVCLLQFMLGYYGVVSDIEKAFLRILIAHHDRDALRFFWFEDPFNYNSKLIIYRFKAVIFGGVCSPFQLAAVINKLITDQCKCTYVKNALLQGTYVDNVLHATNSENQLVQFFNTSRDLFNKGNFNLRQWSSNSPKLMDRAIASNVADQSRVIKVLGLQWNLDKDRFLYNTNIEWNGQFTKRSVLQFTNRVFDPLGLLTPISIRKRLFMQELWKRKLKWKDSFEHIENLKDEWLALVKETHIAVSGTFRRNSYFSFNTEFHIFSDASKRAYGAIIYARTPASPECQDTKLHLIFAKGKVAPLDSKLSIPKLEISGVTVGAHLIPFVTKAWKLGEHHKFFIWCDNKATLHWLSQYNIKDIYVHNRVQRIRSLCSKENTTLRYVPTALNPADLLTKPQKVSKFVRNEDYWSGPKWLLDPNTWPVADETYNMYPEGVDFVTTALPAAIINLGLTSVINFFNRYRFEKGLRILAYVLRPFKSKSAQVINFKGKFVSKEELDLAKLIGIKIMQSDMFLEEFNLLKAGKSVKAGICRKWNLFLDSDGIIRCKGRLLNLLEPRIKNDPILVNAKHPFVEGFISYLHWHTNCSSRANTLHNVRKVIHGPHLTTTVKKIVRQCNTCRILRAQPYSYPEIPPLPKTRLAADKPFAVCGVDYSGPHHVKEGRSRKKVWVALFTCMVSRAVHLEAVPDLTSETFLQSLQCLAWKRGSPKVLMSDNATTFVRANKMLSDISCTKEVKEHLAIEGISWQFTPVRAAWFGAVYERLVGVLKKEMIKLIGHSLISFYELTVNLAEIAHIINSRPLVKVGEEIISPNNILKGTEEEEDSILNVLETEKVIEEALVSKKNLPRICQQAMQRKNCILEEIPKPILEKYQNFYGHFQKDRLWSYPKSR